MSTGSKHRKTPNRGVPIPLHTTVTSDKAVSALWRRRMALMNEVNDHRSNQQYKLAEEKQKEVCEIDAKLQGPDSSGYALSWNKLGELQQDSGNIEDAIVSFRFALDIRVKRGEDFDTAVSRDNIARILETQGGLAEARELRLQGRAARNVACGHYDCPYQQGLGFDFLKSCSQCRSIFYCSPECQKADWKRHKKWCKAEPKPEPTPKPATTTEPGEV